MDRAHHDRAALPDAPRPATSARLAELARGAPTALLLFSGRGALLAQNDLARTTFGAPSLADLFGSEQAAADQIAATRRHGHLIAETELATPAGPVWFLTHLRATSDPESGAFAVSLSAEDLTERRIAERAKDEFISIVNHELRTPLTAIRGAVGLLANNIVDDVPQKAELFDIAWENVLRLGRLVDDLLDVQRLRIGAVDLVIDRIEVAPLVRETLELLAPRAAEAHVALALAEPAPDVAVNADPGRLVQALSNLVTNAMKHAPQGTEVRVEVTPREGIVRVAVHDEGPGVPDAFVTRLFSPFSQADSTDARTGTGAGLGLYIVRTLVEAHGGRVGYEPPPGRGSTFFFELPTAPAPAPDADTAPPDADTAPD